MAIYPRLGTTTHSFCAHNIIVAIIIIIISMWLHSDRERELSKHSPATSGQFARRVAAWLLLGDALEMGIGGCTIAQRYLAAICRI